MPEVMAGFQRPAREGDDKSFLQERPASQMVLSEPEIFSVDLGEQGLGVFQPALILAERGLDVINPDFYQRISGTQPPK